MCHVRRRDNLTAFIHMLVEAIFWFHPLVWWVGRRLEEERERACDEEVMLLCTEPHVYAESILKVCKFCSESPLACVSGITGADLKKRIVKIMTESMVRKLDFGRKLLLLAVGLAAIAVPVMLGQVKAAHPLLVLATKPSTPVASPTSTPTTPMLAAVLPQITATAFAQANAPQEDKGTVPSPTAQPLPVPEWQTAAGGTMSFEVASIRQNKTGGKSSMNVDPTPFDTFTPTGGLYVAKGVAIAEFVTFAYKLTNKQLASFESQVPWSLEDLFDIEARAEGNPTKDQYRLMMQSLLADRFKLVVHFETRDVPLYALVLAKPGKLGPQLRLHRADDPVCDPSPATPLPKPVNRQFSADNEGFPLACVGSVGMVPSAPGRIKNGGRDVPISRLATGLTGVGVVDRPMVDETGIKGNVDYSLEWRLAAANVVPGASFNPDESAPTFDEALKEQLGIKMVSKKGPMEFFVADHIEHPSAN
jgi:uncharacterized protein (TIGR03435 family)